MGSRISLEREVLRAALADAAQAAARGTQVLPALTCVLLEADAKGVSLTCTNLNHSIRRTIPVPASPLRVCIPAEPFLSFLTRAWGQTVTIETAAQGVLLQVGKARMALPSMEADSFPAPADGNPELLGSLDARLFAETVDAVAYAASNETARPALMGIYWTAEGGVHAMTAADGHRFVRRTASLGDVSREKLEVLLYPRSLTLAGKLFPAGGLSVYWCASGIRFDQQGDEGATSLWVQRLGASYPDVSRFFRAATGVGVKVDRARLLAGIGLVGTVRTADGKVPTTRVDVRPDSLRLSVQTEDAGGVEDEIDAFVTAQGEPFSFGVNAGYLREALMHLDGELVWITSAGPEQPIYVEPDGSDDAARAVIAPRRLG